MNRLELQTLFNIIFPDPPLPKKALVLDNILNARTKKFNLKPRFLTQPFLIFMDSRHMDGCIYIDYFSFFKKVIFKFDTLGCLRQAMTVGYKRLTDLDLDSAYDLFEKIYEEFGEMYRGPENA